MSDPEMKIEVKPGQWRLRIGFEVVVLYNAGSMVWPWRGLYDGHVMTWSRSGMFGVTPGPMDLVEYLGQQYRFLEAGEIIQAGDQYLDDGGWVDYESFRFGSKISRYARGRRLVAKELGKIEKSELKGISRSF